MDDGMIEASDNVDIIWKCRHKCYDTKLPYPDRPMMPTLLKKAAGKLTVEEREELPALVEAYEKLAAEGKAARQAYFEDESRLRDQFKADLEEYFGTTGHPKADLLWSKAWENGHSSGYEDVYCHYSDLVELVI